MAISWHLLDILDERLLFAAAVLLAAGCYIFYSIFASERRPWKGFPVIALSEEGLNPKDSWFTHGERTIQKGLDTCSGAFQIMTGTGPKICLPNRFAEELKQHHDLSLGGAFKQDFCGGYPGFEPFDGIFKDHADSSVIPELVQTKLTHSLGLITKDLVDETTAAIHDYLGEDENWHEVCLKPKVGSLVARLSSRAFLGLPLCRNKSWLKLARAYTVGVFSAARALRQVPALVRPILYWFTPECSKLRKAYRDAHDLILPEIERRKTKARRAMEAGKQAPKTADTIAWIHGIAEKKQTAVNYVNSQLELALSSIHTTTESISAALIDVVTHHGILQALRDEITNVVGKDEWSKQVLYKLRLMDSFLKENQRQHPNNCVSMNRLVKKDITLSDGTVLPAGAIIFVANRFRDAKVYTDPDRFDPHRFLHEREKPGQRNAWQHVTLSSDHMAFGYGKSACPGRFFASNEIKIALCHLLLKYDWKVVEGQGPGFFLFESNSIVNSQYKIWVKTRKEEINLDLAEPMSEQSMDIEE